MALRTKRIPLSIDPCPILEAIVELRYESNGPEEASFGLIYGQIKSEFGQDVTHLPILQLPEQIRAGNAQLKHQAHYSLQGDGYQLRIGPHVLAFIQNSPYNGWKSFSE